MDKKPSFFYLTFHKRLKMKILSIFPKKGNPGTRIPVAAHPVRSVKSQGAARPRIWDLIFFGFAEKAQFQPTEAAFWGFTWRLQGGRWYFRPSSGGTSPRSWGREPHPRGLHARGLRSCATLVFGEVALAVPLGHGRIQEDLQVEIVGEVDAELRQSLIACQDSLPCIECFHQAFAGVQISHVISAPGVGEVNAIADYMDVIHITDILGGIQCTSEGRRPSNRALENLSMGKLTRLYKGVKMIH